MNCHFELRSFQNDLKKFNEAGIRIVGISVDLPEQTQKYMLQEAGYTFTFLSDPRLETIRRYDLVHANEIASGKDIARPAEFLIDPSGIVRRAPSGILHFAFFSAKS